MCSETVNQNEFSAIHNIYVLRYESVFGFVFSVKNKKKICLRVYIYIYYVLISTWDMFDEESFVKNIRNEK